MHFVKHLSTSIMNINTIPGGRGGGQRGFKGGAGTPLSLPPSPKLNPDVGVGLTLMSVCVRRRYRAQTGDDKLKQREVILDGELM